MKRLLKEKNKEKHKEKGEKDEFKTEDGYPLEIEINLTESEEKYFFTERKVENNQLNEEKYMKAVEKMMKMNMEKIRM